MRKLTCLQHVVLAGALLLAVGILLAPRMRSSTAVRGPRTIAFSDADAKTEAAIAIVERGKEPMEGIRMLLEVLRENPEHNRALMALGNFSMKTGQYEKAIRRYEKILETTPEIAEVYLRLGECYEIIRKPDKAIENFLTYITLINDPSEIAQLQSRIEKLNNKQTL